MNGPDLIALKSDDPRQKASTRAIPSSPPAAAVRIPLAGSLRLLSYLDQKKIHAACASPASPLTGPPPVCLPTRPAPRPRRPQGRRNGLRAWRAGRPPCGAGSCPQGRGNGLRARRAGRPPCGAGGSRGYAQDVRRERRKGLRGRRAPRLAQSPCAAAHGRQGRVKGLRRAAPPPRPACRAASAHGSITGHRRRRGQGRGSAPTNDWTTCSRLGGGRGWPRGKRSSGQRSRIRGDSHHPAGFSAVPNVPLLTNGQMVRRIQLLLLLLFLLGALLCICRN